MVVSFQDHKFGELCNNRRKLQKKYGDKQAKKITIRLGALKNAICLEDMRNMPGRCHELKEDRKGQFALDLVHPNRLIFVPDHEPIPTKENDEGIDWTAVTSILVLEVTDYHG